MALRELVETYGYAGVFLGTAMEGDIALIAGGLCAKLTRLNLFGVIAAAFAAAFTLDQFFFYLGRLQGLALLRRFPRMHARAERVFDHLRRHRTLIAFGFRFAYGFRVLTPLLLGASGIGRLRFAALNALGAAVWATLMGSLGYVVGEAIRTFLGGVKHHLLPSLQILLLGFLVIRLILHVARRRSLSARAPAATGADSVP
jgi:membrane protein DedA with SNARE-associated domain